VNFFSAWRVPCRAAAFMPEAVFTVVARVWCALYPILVTVSQSAGRVRKRRDGCTIIGHCGMRERKCC